MTIEEAIKHMMHVWEQLNEKVIKLGTTIRKIFRDIFGQREVSGDLQEYYCPEKTVSSER